MKIPPVKGTRDFYPPEMARHNWIIDGWRQVSLRNGFEEYDGPIFEHLAMYQIKSGQEIVEQLFSFQDRGGRDLAIRPEITPTLARMVNQQINSLPRPIKWFSVPRLCRAERPQKGRLREFYQWNIDIIGLDSPLADAEIIFTTVDYLRYVGLTPADVKVKMSSRKLLGAFLRSLGIPDDGIDSLYTLLDKKAKLPPETFAALLHEQVHDAGVAKRILEFMETRSFTELEKMLERQEDDEVSEAFDELSEVERLLREMDVKDYCAFDPSIVRGLAYYTGIVFEVHDIVGELRAICGGGRYDNLLRDFGGPPIAATGMGMGDCVLEILLDQKGLLKVPPHRQLDYFIAFVPKVELLFESPDGVVKSTPEDEAVRLTAQLRLRGYSADFSHESSGLGKQLKRAADGGAKVCIIIGAEFKEGNLVVKDMTTGDQKTVSKDEFLRRLDQK
jgi:histidyl-tRNA synthetase